MCRRKTPQRRFSADWGFSKAKPPIGGEADTVLLGEVGLLFHFHFRLHPSTSLCNFLNFFTLRVCPLSKKCKIS
jgi:hypothetical protein